MGRLCVCFSDSVPSVENPQQPPETGWLIFTFTGVVSWKAIADILIPNPPGTYYIGYPSP